MDKPVILIVDDEDGVRDMLFDFLKQRYDCLFHKAKDGEEAVNFVKSTKCDVLILDIKMPKKSGMAVIPEVKKIDPNIDILILSAWVSEEVALEATQLGATDYAVKPVDLNVISIKLGNILIKRGQKANKTLGSGR